MKANIAYYLLILYALAMCKPVLPFVQDKIAHIFWEAEHITKVHNHDGDEHTIHEIASASHEENDKNASNLKPIEPVSIHLIHPIVQSTPQLGNATTKIDLRTYSASSLSLDKPYPPPRVS